MFQYVRAGLNNKSKEKSINNNIRLWRGARLLKTMLNPLELHFIVVALSQVGLCVFTDVYTRLNEC